MKSGRPDADDVRAQARPPQLSEVSGSKLSSWVLRPVRYAAPGCPVCTSDLVVGAAPAAVYDVATVVVL